MSPKDKTLKRIGDLEGILAHAKRINQPPLIRQIEYLLRNEYKELQKISKP
jgi:hypothetical protein